MIHCSAEHYPIRIQLCIESGGAQGEVGGDIRSM